MDAILLLTLLPLILVNSWHAWLLVRHPKTSRPLTISEHAVESGWLLLAHRVMHAVPLPIFVFFAFSYLIPEGHTVAAVLLMVGATFDVAEVLTLNRGTASMDTKLNAHFVTAWVMALSYLLYGLLISNTAGVSRYVYGTILLVCACLLMFAITNTFKRYFLIMQMLFFVLVSSVVFIAHMNLITQ